MSTIWMVGLSVLGIYVYKRSEEKKIAARPNFTPEQAQSPKTKPQAQGKKTATGYNQ